MGQWLCLHLFDNSTVMVCAHQKRSKYSHRIIAVDYLKDFFRVTCVNKNSPPFSDTTGCIKPDVSISYSPVSLQVNVSWKFFTRVEFFQFVQKTQLMRKSHVCSNHVAPHEFACFWSCTSILWLICKLLVVNYALNLLGDLCYFFNC